MDDLSNDIMLEILNKDKFMSTLIKRYFEKYHNMDIGEFQNRSSKGYSEEDYYNGTNAYKFYKFDQINKFINLITVYLDYTLTKNKLNEDSVKIRKFSIEKQSIIYPRKDLKISENNDKYEKIIHNFIINDGVESINLDSIELSSEKYDFYIKDSNGKLNFNIYIDFKDKEKE